MLMPANFTQSLWTLCELSTDSLGFFPTCWKCGSVQFSSFQSLSCVWLFATPWTAACQASLSITNSWRLCPNSCPLSWWCHLTISSSVVPFSSCLQSFPASVSFPGGQSVEVSASAPVPPMNTKDRFPSGLTGLIPLQSKGLSRVLSNTTVQKYQFFGAQLSSKSNSHIHTWLLEKPCFDYMDFCWLSNVSVF